MPNWSDGEGGCDCPSGHMAGLGRHREGEPGCISGPDEFVGKKTVTMVKVDELIEASSLGTPRAKRLRNSVPKEFIDRVLRRADELGNMNTRKARAQADEETTEDDLPDFQDIAERTLEQYGGKLTAGELAFELAMAYEAGAPRPALFSRRALEDALLDCFALLPPERVRLVLPASKTAIGWAREAQNRRKNKP